MDCDAAGASTGGSGDELSDDEEFLNDDENVEIDPEEGDADVGSAEAASWRVLGVRVQVSV